MEAIEYFNQGYSCSESIVKEAIDKGLCDKSLLSVASSFSGGMGNGCLCGAIAGAQLVIGALYGRENKNNNEPQARALAKKFIEDFKATHKVTCCKILSKGFEFNSPERKQHCTNFVEFCSKNLYNLIGETIKND